MDNLKITFAGFTRDVLHILRLSDYNDREVISNSVKDNRHDNGGDGNRSDRIVAAADVLWRSGSQAQVDRLGHVTVLGERLHLLVAALYLRPAAHQAARADD